MMLRFWLLMGILFLEFHQVLTYESMHQPDKGDCNNRVAQVSGYVQLVASMVSKGYEYFTHDKGDYDLQRDVLDVPYKKMIYSSTQEIELLFDHANKHDNPLVQIKALICLCRIPVPEWYLKSFNKGLDVLYTTCFDEQGNFVDAAALGDIRLVFKDYCKKSPASWQEIAKISSWWCKNKKPYPMYAQHYADTCTDHNEDLLNMISADQIQDFVYLKYLFSKNGSKAARKIYDYQVSNFLKKSEWI